MGDNWDDGSEDDWDVDDDELDNKLGINKKQQDDDEEEEDLAVIEKAREEKLKQMELKKKGNARKEKEQKAAEAKEEEELARKAMELEAEMESKMTIDERRALERKRIEEADHELTNDLFGAVENSISKQKAAGGGTAMQAGDTVNLKDLKDHLKHARKVSACFKKHGKINLVTSFIKELINESSSILDDSSITDIIKSCNVIKNEKVQASKRKVKGEATKIKKVDKQAQAKAKKIQTELYGDSEKYDDYDEMGADYEDAFF